MQEPTSSRSQTNTMLMTDYIRRHFGEMLGPYEALLDEPDGLDQLASLVRSGRIRASGSRAL